MRSTPPGQPPDIITRAQWGADESMRCPNTVYDDGVRAGIVHHTAGSNDYGPQDSAAIVRSIYAYHTRTLGWCDIAYNALVDKFGQVFEGRAGGMDRPVEGAHTGGFNKNTWGVAMLGNFDVVPPTPIQLRTVGRLLGWRLGIDHVDPRGTVVLTSDGGSFSSLPEAGPPRPCRRSSPTATSASPTALATRPTPRWTRSAISPPVSTNRSPPPSLTDILRGGAILAKWESIGGDEQPARRTEITGGRR